MSASQDSPEIWYREETVGQVAVGLHYTRSTGFEV